MTEEKWKTATGIVGMLAVPQVASNLRKMRLFGVACCRQVLGWSADAPVQDTLAIAEQYADGELTDGGVRRRSRAVTTAYYTLMRTKGAQNSKRGRAELLSLTASMSTLEPEARNAAKSTVDRILGGRAVLGDLSVQNLRKLFPDLLRCIFGNPFHPVTLDPSWLTSTALALARGIYVERAFDRMPILADGLQDAGCNNEAILDHCRGPGPHTRGCWVCDLGLGKE
jgi:hypothetical protein